MRRTLSLIAVLAAAALACDDSAPSSGSDTSSATAGMLESAVDPGIGRSIIPETDGNVGASRPPSGIAAPGAGAPAQEYDLSDLGYDSGDTTAAVRIVEFSDFGCGYCRQFHLEAYPQLEEEYMATGKVIWKYVPMILGMFPNALEAAETGECAGEQNAFPRVRDLIFEEQSAWKSAGDPWPVLNGIAEEAGLDMARFRSCIDEGRRRDRIVAGTRISREVGVRGTPTFFIVGYAPIPGAVPLETFRMVIDTVYAQAIADGAGDAGDR